MNDPKSSNPLTRRARKPVSTMVSSTIAAAIELSTATLVPGCGRRWMSAKRASSMRRGSMTIRPAPRSAACLMRAPTTGCASVVFDPHTTMVRARSISSKEFVAAPVPNTAARPAALGAWHTLAQQSMLLVPSTTRANFCAR